MNIGEKIMLLRKQLGMSQADLAKALGVSRTIVGNYERNTNVPSVDTVRKLAIVLNVSTDYLLDASTVAQYDKEIIKRIEAIEELNDEVKEKLYFIIDNVVQNQKARQAYL